MSSDVSPLDIVTLLVAILGAVTGILALVLQAVLWGRSGPQITVDMRVAWVMPDGGGVITTPMAHGTVPPDPNYVGPFYAVTVVNSGRAATTVDTAGIETTKARFVQTTPPFGPALGIRLESEASETWYGDMANVVTTVKSSQEVLGGDRGFRAFAELGSGREVAGPWYTLAQGSTAGP